MTGYRKARVGTLVDVSKTYPKPERQRYLLLRQVGNSEAVREVMVDLGARSYTVQIGPGLLDAAGPACAKLRLGRRAASSTQPAVAAARDARHEQPPRRRIRTHGPRRPGGRGEQEPPRGRAALGRVRGLTAWTARSPVVAVGGGVVGDLAGFAGSAFMRGLPVIQVPTTLLAQVDASVGGKVAVNHPRGKNLIGAFHQPRLVLIDPETLRTLPEREYRSGLAEIVKTGAALDAELFRALEAGVDALRRRDASLLESVVATCCAAKARIVERDEREETGLRMVLNYGHTVGHALEALSGYRRWTHGEAVAIGMAAAGVSRCGSAGWAVTWRRARTRCSRRSVFPRGSAALTRGRSWTRCATTRKLGTGACPSS